MRHEAFKIKELEINDFVVFTRHSSPIDVGGVVCDTIYKYLGSEYYEDDENYTGEWYLHKFQNTIDGIIKDIWSRSDLFYQSKDENIFVKLDNLEIAKLLYETKQAKI